MVSLALKRIKESIVVLIHVGGTDQTKRTAYRISSLNTTGCSRVLCSEVTPTSWITALAGQRIIHSNQVYMCLWKTNDTPGGKSMQRGAPGATLFF